MSSKTLKGFSGIIHLVSNIDRDIDAIKELYTQPSTIAPLLTQNGATEDSLTNKQQASINSLEKTSDNYIVITIFIILIFIFIFSVLASHSIYNEQPVETRSHTENEQSSVGEVVLEYTEPPVGAGNLLTMSMIRWCLREEIRLNYLKPIAYTENYTHIFNSYVDDYNKRCQQKTFSQQDLLTARQDVEKDKNRILTIARDEVDTWRKLPKIFNKSPEQASFRGDAKLIKAIQEALRMLGYNPGTADGIVGTKTIRAIKLFQRKMGLEVTGEIDANFIEALKSQLER